MTYLSIGHVYIAKKRYICQEKVTTQLDHLQLKENTYMKEIQSSNTVIIQLQFTNPNFLSERNTP